MQPKLKEAFMKMMMTISTWFLVLGGIVLGYEAVLGTNVLHTLVGGYPLVETAVSTFIGISALFVGYTMVTKKA